LKSYFKSYSSIGYGYYWDRRYENLTSIGIPNDIIAGLDAGKNPPVKVTINDFTYRSTAVRNMVPLSTENRIRAKIKPGDSFSVSIELDIEIPIDLQIMLDENLYTQQEFNRLPSIKKIKMIGSILDAKREKTRLKRLEIAAKSLIFSSIIDI
jgi:hypothetical protein